ncbi:TetR/AcrR family transcriptional regulator [Streptantibioticus cattleyicolor]|uniref:Putative lactone-dependent transcriptional regulator n=2 Tax=Streptantibioticus cattleyicolor TaxID=29303 RepID=F8JND0_STREN|nr:TetR/AcrR family transcriptional regulator [Streptantibioticus cattleyicolor]AEW99108.1 putative lactone-dependent transcriptional regulator [Streptantibioticus cattleyicolor NRRL 8057 = DSM 46488]CAD18970.1 putative lactone-dependent transcriptional regulator [Streptantibioticus cattleyicolor]CCB71847.1 Putative lactone-dependent transcriptional regulator [Streptantibioticus cattleyicolor NRRL 8057 = DSM 46488]
MARLTRAETQERNRDKVLDAAREEFAERGYRDARIDAIAERAGLTRGAVYSNFPGKRALYFAVLAALAERVPEGPPPRPVRSGGDALAAFARAWVSRLPPAGDDGPGPARLAMDLMPEVITDAATRRPFAQLLKLDAILLGLALERLEPAGRPARRMVRVAEAVLTALHGTAQLAAAAPGFLDPLDAVRVCERLAGLPLDDDPPPAPGLPPVHHVDEPWSPPPATDAVTGDPLPADGEPDQVVTVLGLHRLEAAEDAVRAAPPDTPVTAVLVTADPGELGALARLSVAELCGCLRQAFPASARPPLRVVHDPSGAFAAAAGVPAVDDRTETAIRLASARVTARAQGPGAARAVAATPRRG